MMNKNGKNDNMLALTDCLYFTNGSCIFKNKCHYRHCQTAIKQLEKCVDWPDLCRNINCPYRHTGTPSKSVPKQKGLISFFWDIENVPIPKGQKPFDIVQRIRQKFVIEPGLQEADFSCYCDSAMISESNQISLHHANVRIIHVPDRKPGAADRQIMLDLARFERVHRPPATAVLISGDIDFVGTLSGLRHQAGFRVIVIHNKPAKEELKLTADAHYPWELFAESLHEQQQQPIIGNGLGRFTGQPAKLRPVTNDRLDDNDNAGPTVSAKLKQPSSTSISYSHNKNDLHRKDALPPKFSPTLRRSSVSNGNHHPMEHTRPQKTKTVEPASQMSARIADSHIPPSVPKSIITPRARIRSTSISQLDRQNLPMFGSSEQIYSTINDQTAKTQRNPLPCPHCTNEFSSKQALRQHQKDKKHLFYCPVCKEGFPTSYSIKQHQAAKGHGISHYTCDQCNLKFDTVDSLNMHRLAACSEHNSNMPNKDKRLPVYQHPAAIYSTIDRNINNINYVSDNED
jgi:hypothetical protein